MPFETIDKEDSIISIEKHINDNKQKLLLKVGERGKNGIIRIK